MLAFLGFLTVVLMLVLIMTKKASPLVALIAVPVVTGIISCFFFVTDPEGNYYYAVTADEHYANCQKAGIAGY